jgi:hypothetical protein
MNTRHINPRLAVAVLAAVFAVVLAGPAQADPPGDTLPSGYVYFGPGTNLADDSTLRNDRAHFPERTAPAAEPAVRPDDRAWRGTGPAPVSLILVPDDRADRRLPNTGFAPRATTADRFDWGDAGIGAGAAFGLALLVTGASVFALRHRRAAALS